ncbi:MAG: hypothetical protein ABSE56_00745 [Bryobacteraceae bacterium]|jgi:hypothetical protein
MKRKGWTVAAAWCAMFVDILGGPSGRADQRGAGFSIFETQYSCLASGLESSLGPEDLTVLGFTIGVSTIRDVQKRFPGTLPVRLAYEEEAEDGICIKNEQGMAVVFATGVVGAPDTLVAIYLAPVRLVENPRVTCKSVALPSRAFSSRSGVRVGATSAKVGTSVRAKVPTDGPFCAAHEIASGRGPLRVSKSEGTEGHDFTGAEGYTRAGRLEWIKLFGIASD